MLLLEIFEKTKNTYLDRVCKLLFNQPSGLVKDKKRSNEAIFLGIAHTKSTIVHNDKQLSLTFDNSTDSGEFEINSLSPLKIEKDSDLDLDVKNLYKIYNIKSTKKTNYVSVDSKLVLREIHLGKEIEQTTVDFVADLLKLLKERE